MSDGQFGLNWPWEKNLLRFLCGTITAKTYGPPISRLLVSFLWSSRPPRALPLLCRLQLAAAGRAPPRAQSQEASAGRSLFSSAARERERERESERRGPSGSGGEVSLSPCALTHSFYLFFFNGTEFTVNVKLLNFRLQLQAERLRNEAEIEVWSRESRVSISYWWDIDLLALRQKRPSTDKDLHSSLSSTLMISLPPDMLAVFFLNQWTLFGSVQLFHLSLRRCARKHKHSWSFSTRTLYITAPSLSPRVRRTAAGSVLRLRSKAKASGPVKCPRYLWWLDEKCGIFVKMEQLKWFACRFYLQLSGLTFWNLGWIRAEKTLVAKKNISAVL